MRTVGQNAVLNIIKTVLTILFPVITYPYVFRTLGVTGIGRYTFSASIISYFSLIAGLGINGYAIREGARLRGDREKINRFASEVFSIQIYSLTTALGLLLLACSFVNKFFGYRDLIAILSIEIVLSSISLNWVYTVFEDYTFTTVISVILEAVSLLSIFLLVKSQQDVRIYAAISVISNYGYAVFTFFYAKRYVSIRWRRNPSKRHLKPVFLLFFSSIATTIYINSDITLLGWMIGDDSVGIYGAASKIYIITKYIVNAAVTVTIPRMAYYIGNECFEKARAFGRNVLDGMFLICVPTLCGLFFTSDLVIKVFSGGEFIRAATPLRILSIALVFAVFANFYVNCILMALKKEKVIMTAAVISAVVNIVLNVLLIPFFGENAAAFTTVCAEVIICMIGYLVSRRDFKVGISMRNIGCCLTGCGAILIICFFVRKLSVGDFWKLVISVLLSISAYGLLQVILKNPICEEVISNLVKRKQKKY